jgi:hypothetical protein
VTTLRLLPEFGVSLLPAQLTSLPDKHQLLQRILFGRHTSAAAAAAAAAGSNVGWAGSSVAPWRRLGDVLELAALLGFGSEDEQNEVGPCGVVAAALYCLLPCIACFDVLRSALYCTRVWDSPPGLQQLWWHVAADDQGSSSSLLWGYLYFCHLYVVVFTQGKSCCPCAPGRSMHTSHQ